MRMLAGLLLATLSTAGGTQDSATPKCAAIDADLPRDLVAWRDRHSSAKRPLTIGLAATLELRPIAGVRYAAVPEKSGAAGTFGTAITLEIASRGTYRVALSDAAWIDVVEAGKRVASTEHGHGPACSSIRKVVAFPLSPGRHTLHLSGSTKDRIGVLVTPAS